MKTASKTKKLLTKAEHEFCKHVASGITEAEAFALVRDRFVDSIVSHNDCSRELFHLIRKPVVVAELKRLQRLEEAMKNSPPEERLALLVRIIETPLGELKDDDLILTQYVCVNEAGEEAQVRSKPDALAALKEINKMKGDYPPKIEDARDAVRAFDSDEPQRAKFKAWKAKAEALRTITKPRK